MFQCIACTKPAVVEDGDEGDVRQSGTPTRKEAVKSLTAQIKDIVLKFSGAYKTSKGSSSSQGGVQYPYMGGVASGSASPWDLRANFTDGRLNQMYLGGTIGNQTPRAQEPPAPKASVLEEENENKEWVAQVEPGVDLTFVSLANGGNDLRRIRFDRDMFDKWQAQVWWGENFDRIRELYNVRSYNTQALNTPPPSEEDERDFTFSRNQTGTESSVAGWGINDSTMKDQYYNPSGFTMGQGSSSHQNMVTAGSSGTSSKISNASEMESDWIEQVDPGVFVTIRQFPDGNKELRRIRFSRQRFGDDDAKKWWEENKARIQAQYM